MMDKRITIRLENYLYEALEVEAKKRGQTVVSLTRGFIRDGLFNYDAMGEVLMQSQEKIEACLKLVEIMAGANLHVAVEQKTLRNDKKPEESPADFSARLQSLYIKNMNEAVSKAALINDGLREKLDIPMGIIKRKKPP